MVRGKIEPCAFSDSDAHRGVTSSDVIRAVDDDESHLRTNFSKFSSEFSPICTLERPQNGCRTSMFRVIVLC
jgi:hypothetical protein